MADKPKTNVDKFFEKMWKYGEKVVDRNGGL